MFNFTANKGRMQSPSVIWAIWMEIDTLNGIENPVFKQSEAIKEPPTGKNRLLIEEKEANNGDWVKW